MHRMMGLILLATCWTVGGCAAGQATVPNRLAETDTEQIMAVLDRYMDALNALDLEGHLATYHFPHYRHASGEITIWETAQDVSPLFRLPVSERRARLRSVLEPDWHHSEWTRREIVQGDEGKVHVVTRFERRREDGSVITAYDSLYVLTRAEGGWGIKGRSSFAP